MLKSEAFCGQRRSREGAWIEIDYRGEIMLYVEVAPVRERGLKS